MSGLGASSSGFGAGAVWSERWVMCPICAETVEAANLLEICPSGHLLCFECIARSVNSQFMEGRPPACPLAVECHHALTDDQLRLFMDEQDFSQLQERRTRALLAGNNDYIACPANGCPEYFFRGGEFGANQATCPTCQLNFCVHCLGLFHHHARCDQVGELRLQWIEWVRNGRDANMQQRRRLAADLEHYSNELLAYSRHRREVLSRFELHKSDEEYKAKHCKHCPQCNRIVEKMEGCDAMRCGADYHLQNGQAANRQNGCGAEFNWTSARPYRAENLGAGPDVAAFALQAPKDAQNAFHGRPCSQCGNDIVGVRFQCVHCPDFNLCEKCDATTEHHPSHVFRLHTAGLLPTIASAPISAERARMLAADM